jgi:hypothetical protein
VVDGDVVSQHVADLFQLNAGAQLASTEEVAGEGE